MGQTDRSDGRRAAGSRLSSNSESAIKGITKRRNPESKMQENRDPPPAFLQNRILAQAKSQRHINRFRILHGRLYICGKGARSSASTHFSWNMSRVVVHACKETAERKDHEKDSSTPLQRQPY